MGTLLNEQRTQKGQTPVDLTASMRVSSSFPVAASPGPGQYNTPTQFSPGKKGFTIGNMMNDEMKVKIGYDPLSRK
jgi:hypothetical protein